MTPLQRLRADQHDDLTYPSDAALHAYLTEVSTADVLRDRLPHTAVELRHLARIQGTS